jgi:hypothetical protein
MPARRHEFVDWSLWSPVDSYLVGDEVRDLEFWLRAGNATKFLEILWTHSTSALLELRPRGYALCALFEALSEAHIRGPGICWQILPEPGFGNASAAAETLFNAGIHLSLALDRECAAEGLKVFGSGPPPDFCETVATCYSRGLSEQMVAEALTYYRAALATAAAMDAQFLVTICFME